MRDVQIQESSDNIINVAEVRISMLKGRGLQALLFSRVYDKRLNVIEPKLLDTASKLVMPREGNAVQMSAPPDNGKRHREGSELDGVEIDALQKKREAMRPPKNVTTSWNCCDQSASSPLS